MRLTIFLKKAMDEENQIPGGESTPPEAGNEPAIENGEGITPPENPTPANAGGEKAEVEEDTEPPVRKEKAREFYQKRKQSEQQGKEEDPSELEYSQEEKEMVESIVQRSFGKHFQSIEEQRLQSEAIAIESEVKTFRSEFPEITDKEAEKIKRWSMHEAYQNVPVKSVAFAALGDRMLEIGAERGKTSYKEKKGSASAGGTSPSVGGEGGQKDWTKVSNEEFKKEQARVLNQR